MYFTTCRSTFGYFHSKNITVTKTGVNLSMVWKHQPSNTAVHSGDGSSVIKKLGIPVSKLIGEPEKPDLQGYVQR